MAVSKLVSARFTTKQYKSAATGAQMLVDQ